MSNLFRLSLISCLVLGLSACDSDSSESISDSVLADGNSPTSGQDASNTDGSTADNDNTDADAGDNTGAGGNTGTGDDTDAGDTTDAGDNTGTGDTTDAGGNTGTPVFPNPSLDDGRPTANGLPAPVIPELDPLAAPIPAPDSADPFGSLLEIDNEVPVLGGAPTQPKNLRIDLVSNDWAEFSWAPANDDGEVVEYRISRSDGHVYSMLRDQTSTNAGTQAEMDKLWATTSFIDCNYTRFTNRVHNCELYGPEPGDTFTYQVTAVDDEGNESAPSNPITITYHVGQGAPVPLYLDRFLDASNFAQTHDLSNPGYYLDDFTLVFEEDFDGTAIDDSRWNTQLVWGDQEIINNEQQYFVNPQRTPNFGYNPFRLENSILTIEAIPTPEELVPNLPETCFLVNEFRPPCQFLSGALSTHDKFNMTFGYVEARMKTSDISGALSSFYLFHRFPGEGLERHGPEIDILEYLGENPFGDEDAFQTYHFEDVTTGITRSSPTMMYENEDGELYSDDFHTYGVLWEPQLVIWYIDGEEIKRLSGPQVAARAMNIVTYLVAGSAWAPTPDADGEFPLQLEIDYIRAYQRDAYVGNGLYPQ